MRSQDGISGLFFGSLPNLEDLVAAKATIQLMNKGDEISPIQPMCCRELIFTESKVLVSPLLEERNKLFLITTKLTFQSSQFQELLQKLNIQNTEPVDLTRSLFQFCFSFTMKQKLAPLWNKAGEFLVQGRDFMQETSKLNAITLEVTISDKICIALQACSLKSAPCKPEHFTASTKALEEFNTNSESQISDAAISDDLCFVLPSLKKGRIFSITHKLPENCPFASYEELRKHWKLMYGYRLPPEENVFYNVHFYYIRGKVFTYPASCIRSSQALVSPRCDHQLIFSSFLKDLSCRMPAVCGAPLTLTSSPLYPTSSLKHATHTNHSNLTRSAPPQFSHCRPFSIQTQHTTQDSARQGVTSPPNSQLTSSQASSQTESSQRSNTINPPLISPIGSSLTSTPFVPRFTSTRVLRTDESQRTAPSSLVRPSLSGARIIPMFSRKRAQSHVKDTTGSKNSGHTAFAREPATLRGATPRAVTAISTSRVPLVRSTVHAQNASSSVLSQNSPRVAERERMENVFEGRNVRLEHTIPDNRSFNTYQINLEERSIDRGRFQGITETPLSHGRTIEGLSKNSPSSFNGLDVPSARSPNTANTSTQVSKRLPQTRPGLVISQATTGSHLAASCTGNVLVTQGPARDITSPHMEQLSMMAGNYSTLRGTPMSDFSPGQLFEPFSTSFQSSGVLARKRQVINGFSNEDTAPKKPKSKPKLQENVDVRELAIQDQLHKVNTVTLADWLKKRGVAVKSKDKKADLASKVKQRLGLIQHEQ